MNLIVCDNIICDNAESGGWLSKEQIKCFEVKNNLIKNSPINIKNFLKYTVKNPLKQVCKWVQLFFFYIQQPSTKCSLMLNLTQSFHILLLV